jgi:hypothetical protein
MGWANIELALRAEKSKLKPANCTPKTENRKLKTENRTLLSLLQKLSS